MPGMEEKDTENKILGSFYEECHVPQSTGVPCSFSCFHLRILIQHTSGSLNFRNASSILCPCGAKSIFCLAFLCGEIKTQQCVEVTPCTLQL